MTDETMYELSDTDYRLLELIAKYGPLDKNAIDNKAKTKIDALDYRLGCLKLPQFKQVSAGVRFPIDDTSYIDEEYSSVEDKKTHFTHIAATGVYSISRLGQKVLQDYKAEQKARKRETWFKSIWCPIIVAFITSLVINGIAVLLPLIQQWLASTP